MTHTPLRDLATLAPLELGVSRYADIVYQPMTAAAARLECVPGRRCVLYIAEDARLEDQCVALAEAHTFFVTADPTTARSAQQVARLRLVS